MRRIFNTSLAQAGMALAIVITALCVLSGCSKAHAATTPAASKTAAKKTSTPPVAQTTLAIAPPPTNIFVSVFSTDNPRDPFHPKNKPKGSSQAVLAGPAAESELSQVVSALQAGFQGIFGSAEERELMVHGVLMPENRETTVVVPVNGQPRRVKVKAVKIYRNTAQLQVEGLPQPITVPKAR